MQYKIIPGFSLYKVSRCGSVVGMRGRVMHPETDKDGYLRLRVRRDSNGTKRRAGVHDLVLRAWDREPLPGEIPNHKNGIKDDNRIENLEWTSVSGNSQHAYDMGLRVAPWSGVRGERHPGHGHVCPQRRRLDLNKVRTLLSSGLSMRKVAAKLGTTHATISHLIGGKHWQSAEFLGNHG